MVALHNRKLTANDLWPGILWTDADRSALIDKLRAAMIAEGWNFSAAGVEGAKAGFQLARRIEDYQRQFPSWGERQKILAAIYPAKRAPAPFGLDELRMIRDRFNFDNDPAGQAISRRAADLVRHITGGE